MNPIRTCLTSRNFKELFVEHLGWNAAKETIYLQDGKVKAEAVANLKGLVVLLCTPTDGQFPGSAERKRIQREVAKLHHEHILIFLGEDRQVWQVPKRVDGKTKSTSEITYYNGKAVEHLARRVESLKYDTFEQADEETLVGVSKKVSQALVADKVTKNFFKQFSDRRKSLLEFLIWIEDESKRDWYCSVLLNRLMFIYFIAEKGFLPGGRRFLSEQLARNAETNGKDTFYTHFLLPLSFFGFGEKQGDRQNFEAQFKDVLYLNGGLFAVHSLEAELGISKEAVRTGSLPKEAKIPDAEFHNWLTYFNDWRWTLDEDKVDNDGDISPHILGYIFEKYINQKQMGAYYTKDDITGYICRNTIIPRLFDMLAESSDKGKKAVDPLPIGPHPNLLNEGRGISEGEGIDRYVYPSVKQEDKLPTETDYEQKQRRSRYESILTDFDEGKIARIDDFITYNLDIERLALDFVSNIQDPEVMHRFYFRCLRQITVLDPTCGSGAFLFAALNILYPLYNAALSRMQFLVGKATGQQPDVVNWGGKLHFDDLDIDQSTLADFVGDETPVLAELRAEVERINDHPSAEYFIKKTIIVNNLFGVDIMEEAVEICKLRLFLSLISTVERDDAKPNHGVEPLPDIDFNIVAGNTLVGYASIADIDRLWHEVEHQSVVGKDGSVQKQTGMMFDKDHSKLQGLVAEYGRMLQAWNQQQLGEWDGKPITKEQVLRAAEEVRGELDPDLWRLYRTAGVLKDKVTLAEFKRTHQPLHWLLEFPQIEASGGFDVIVGNPPFLDLKTNKLAYHFISRFFTTHRCGNLYALCVERCIPLVFREGRFGMIMPVSAISTDGFRPVQVIFSAQQLAHVSSFDDRPAKLFDGLEHLRACIALIRRGAGVAQVFTSKYNKWMQAERDHLFTSLVLERSSIAEDGTIPKLSFQAEHGILRKLGSTTKRITDSYGPDVDHKLYFARKVGYFLNIYDFIPTVRDNEGRLRMPSELKELTMVSESASKGWLAALNSSLFNWFFTVHSDCRHLNKREIESFPFDPSSLDASATEAIGRCAADLMTRLRATSEVRSMSSSSGRIAVECIFPRNGKDLIDEIDRILAQHYGFTDEELEFILNYDLKYRMGSGGVSDE